MSSNQQSGKFRSTEEKKLTVRVGLLERILNRFDFEFFSNTTLTDNCNVFGYSILGFYE